MFARARAGSPRGGLVVACLLLSSACSFTPSPGGDGGAPDARDEVPPEVGFTFAQSTTDEAAGTHTITVSLTRASTAPVTVTVAIDPSGSASAQDASLVAPTVTIPAGQTSGAVELAIAADGEVEDDETVVLTLASASGATIGAAASHQATISADVLPRIDFTTISSTALEAAGTQVLALQLDRPAPGPIELAYLVTGTAVAPADHGLVAGTLLVAAGATSAELTLDVRDDVSDEDDESVRVEIAVTSGAVAGPNTTRDHVIGDDDAPPTVGFSTASTSLADGGTAQLTVTLAPASGKTVTVGYAIGGDATVEAAEYTLPPGPLTFAPGEVSKTISIPFAADTVDEDDETLDLTLGMFANSDPGPITSHRITLVDDDAAPTLTLSPGNALLGEGAGSTDLSVFASAVSERTITFTLQAVSSTASPGDYSLALGPHTLPPGTTGLDVPFAAVNDTTDENDEIVVASIQSANNATLGGAGTISCAVTIDDDDGPTVRFDPADPDQSIDEGNGSGTDDYSYDVILSGPSVQTVQVMFSVGGDATNTDRSILTTSPLTFAPGQTRRAIIIRVNRDNAQEQDNDVVLTLTGATDATVVTPTVRTHTINNDD